MALLSGGPRQRGTEQGMHQGFVVGEQSELAALQEESEMTDGGVSCQKLPVKGRALGFGGGKLLGIKVEWRPGTMDTLLEDST